MNKARSPKLDVLAIAAHPDDVELTCGGTLIQCVKRGYRAGILDLTRGEMGTRGTPEQRAREAAAAARVLGVHHRENLGLPDAQLEVSLHYKKLVAARIRALRPRVVILPYWEGRHPDHVVTSRLGYEACYIAGLKKFALPGAPHRPFKILYAVMFDQARPAPPTFVVDISAEYAQRARAIACYRSQLAGPRLQRGIHIPLTGLAQHMATLCGYYGRLIGARYGEPFVTRETMQADDILALSVRSI